MSLTRSFWLACLLATALAPLVATAGDVQQTDASTGAPNQAWSFDGPWTGVASDQSRGVIYAIGLGGKCVELNAEGKRLREIELPKDGGSVLRLATLRGGAKALLNFVLWTHELRAFDLSGKQIWSYPISSGIDDVWAADLNGNGSDEVIVGYNGGNGVHVLNGNGLLLWKSTDVQNVWHVCAGDVMGAGNPQVVTTSAEGTVHIFSIGGKKIKDLDAGCYATMVRIGEASETKAAPILIVGSAADGGADQKVVIVTALSADNTKRWSLKVPVGTVPFVSSAAVAPRRPWLAVAVGVQGGAVHVVDYDKGRVIASLKDQGQEPEVGWLKCKGAATPLLLIATGSKLNAFRLPESKE
jgi:outer membrane protein assembly factor BamB